MAMCLLILVSFTCFAEAGGKLSSIPVISIGVEKIATADDPLDRWMANYLSIKDVECDFKFYSTEATTEYRADLLLANPTIDSRGYILLQDFHYKFRPKDRLYFLKGQLLVRGKHGGFGGQLNSFDGDGHRTFAEQSYSGVIHPDEPISVRLLTNPIHFICLDVDLESLYLEQKIVRESDRVYSAVVPIGRGKQAKFHLSPEHGFMPHRIEAFDMDGKAEVQFTVEKFQQVNGLWMPITGTRTLFREKCTDRIEIVPESLKVNQGLLPQDFRFEYPAGSAHKDMRSGELVVGDEFRRRQNVSIATAAARTPAPTRTNFGNWIWLLYAAAICGLLYWGHRRFIVNAVVLFTLAGAGCDYQSPSANVNIAELVIENPVAETCVSAENGGEFVQEFVVFNNSEKSITITSLDTNCACISAKIDDRQISKFGRTKLRLMARLDSGIKDQSLSARITASNGLGSTALWSIRRSSNWRPFQTSFSMETMAGINKNVGPFYFEIGESVVTPQVTIVDEDDLFRLAGDVRVTEESSSNRRIEFELTANPVEVLHEKQYMIRVLLAGGEPSYFLLTCDLNVLPKIHFDVPVVRMERNATELVLHSIEEPSDIRSVVTPANYEVTWTWDSHEQLARILLTRKQDIVENGICELSVNVQVQGEILATKCKLVPASP